MPTIQKSAIVPHNAHQMYSLVNDIARYPEFIHWVQRTDILSQDEDEVRASLYLNLGGLHKSFTTCNRLQPDKMIEIRLIDGPFRYLDGFWRFDPQDAQHSRVSLDLNFEFSNRFIGLAVGPVFSQVANTLVDAFSKRADEVYVKGAGAIQDDLSGG